MKRFALLQPFDTVFNIIEDEQKPKFARNIHLVELNEEDGDVQIGWKYDGVTDTFTPPIISKIPEIPPTEINDNQLALMRALSDLFEKIDELNVKLDQVGGGNKMNLVTAPRTSTKLIGLDELNARLIQVGHIKIADLPKAKQNNVRMKLMEQGYDEEGKLL